MSKIVTIFIDGQEYQVPEGINLVDAAKTHDTAIPVFCYHPKMEPVGMCRMCLVELGSVSINRETGEPEHDEDGHPVVRWYPKLQTACTQLAHEGMVVRTATERVAAARDSILEFILTSHPLDCPICDKGGECPLQNLTMAYGPGESHFIFDDKIKLDKHVPLSELIFLDRERCIQCARCTRFCVEIVGDDVLAFHERGRKLQIVTISDPPFDTKFSGNTTDICPVGALTTADFRFGARPWELDQVPTICPHCPVGCNISASTRLDRDFGGKKKIKRIMPRQNEAVNEIWICDKGRFGHHHSQSAQRMQRPIIRKGEEFVETDWATAYEAVVSALRQHRERTGFLAGLSLSNEDLWEMRKLARLTSPECGLGLWPAAATGIEQVTQVGVGVGTRLQDLGADSAILVIATDLEEEAPIWWLQVKQAADRGTKVIVANGRETKLDRYAHTVVRYAFGKAVAVLNSFSARARSRRKLDKELIAERADGFEDFATALKGVRVANAEAADALIDAENLIVFAGNEGLTLEQHGELMQAAANLLIITGHVGKPNNGLVGVWPGANMQGALDMGFSSEATAGFLTDPPVMWLIAEADPLAADNKLAQVINGAEFVVVSAQFMTPTATRADVILPVQSFAERDGTFTSGMRRVQRFYMAQGVVGESLPSWRIFARLGALMGGDRPRISAGLVMRDITQSVLRYSEMGFTDLARVEPQSPYVGDEDRYYGGTAYRNEGGLGIQWLTNAEREKYLLTVRPVKTDFDTPQDLMAVPIRLLFNREALFEKSNIMHHRVPAPFAEFNVEDADRLGFSDGDRVALVVDDRRIEVAARVNGKVPLGVVLLPLHLAPVPMPTVPVACAVEKIEE